MLNPALLILSIISGAIVIAVLILLLDGIRYQLRTFPNHDNQHSNKAPLLLEVIAREDLSDDIFSLKLCGTDGMRLPTAKAGQFITLLIPIDEEKTLRRCYSLAAWTENPTFYEILIKHEKTGTGSRWLHRNLTPGRKITALLPRGQFVLESISSNEIVFIAGGIGITPIRAMLHRINAEKKLPKSVSVTLYYIARQQERLLHHAEFQSLEKASWFRYCPILTRPDVSWNGLTDRLDVAQILEQLKSPHTAQFYFCAPSALMQDLAKELKARGIAESQLHFESFGGSFTNTNLSHYPVTILPDTRFQFRGQSSLLSAMHEEGLNLVNSDCRIGSCGSCKMRLIDGEVRWLIQPEYKTNPDEILPCCCVPQKALTLKH